MATATLAPPATVPALVRLVAASPDGLSVAEAVPLLRSESTYLTLGSDAVTEILDGYARDGRLLATWRMHAEDPRLDHRRYFAWGRPTR